MGRDTSPLRLIFHAVRIFSALLGTSSLMCFGAEWENAPRTQAFENEEDGVVLSVEITQNEVLLYVNRPSKQTKFMNIKDFELIVLMGKRKEILKYDGDGLVTEAGSKGRTGRIKFPKEFDGKAYKVIGVGYRGSHKPILPQLARPQEAFE